MIYKCKNCGLEYDTTVDYCECGNNTFEIINTVPENIPSAPEDEYDEYGEKIIKSEKISPENNSDLEFLYQTKHKSAKNGNEENKNSQNLLSVIFFIISTVVSIILIAAALTIPSADKNKNIPPEIQEQKNREISQIANKNVSLPEKQETTENTEKQNEQIKKVQTQNQTPKQQTKSPSVTKKTVQKTQAQKINTNKTAKPVQEKKKEQIKAVNPKSDVQKADTKKINKPDTSEADKTKLNIYKANLRQYLFSAFPILTVQGSGTASVGFSVSGEGKLINRRFVSQSNNKSLNDAMYHMLMKAPVYTAPPSCYKGEEFILEMKYNNGQYSFSYLK